jgi:hypothetical protein
MQEITVTAIQAIQAILAPALGISAVGLLLLGLSNRYSTIINRIRLLNDEKRRFHRQIAEKGDLGYTDNARLMSITHQTQGLLGRSRLVRNAILSLQVAIALFVLSSVMIALSMFVPSQGFQTIPLFVFVLGMVSVFVGVVFAGTEVYRSYKIVLIEVTAEE